MSSGVSFIMRESSGQVHRLIASNRSYKWAVNNMRMVRQDSDHIRAIQEEFKEFFGPPKGIVPENFYGIIVVDLVSKIILSAGEDGSGVGSFFYAGIHLDLPLGGFTHLSDDDENDAFRFLEFFNEGRILHTRTWRPESRSVIPYDISGKSLEEVASLISQGTDHPFNFMVDLSPFSIERFSMHQREHVVMLLSRIKALEFDLTQEESAGWDQYLAQL